jgi:hypothetical protein
MRQSIRTRLVPLQNALLALSAVLGNEPSMIVLLLIIAFGQLPVGKNHGEEVRY